MKKRRASEGYISREKVLSRRMILYGMDPRLGTNETILLGYAGDYLGQITEVRRRRRVLFRTLKHRICSPSHELLRR